MNKKNVLQISVAAITIELKGLFAAHWRKRPKLIAFTFDDGPSQYTEPLLDGLEARNVTATFFMNGENGTGGTCGIKNGHEELLTRMWESGHQLANHTYQHTNLIGLSAEQITSEVTRVEDLIFDAVGGRYQCLVRTPGGHLEIKDNINAPIILWSVDSLDWKHRNTDYVYNKIISSVKSGNIILMHDIYESSVKGALRAIDTLKTQGYEFVTVSELMRRTGVRLTNRTAYYKGKKGIVFHPGYKAPMTTISESNHSGLFEITCSIPDGLSIYYTTDETYPKLSDQLYREPVLVESGTVFTAIGVDQWGTRTPPTVIVTGSTDPVMGFSCPCICPYIR